MSLSPVTIRPATVGDAASIAGINAQGWLDSYVGLMPASLLARVEPKPEQWARKIAEMSRPSDFLVAIEEGLAVGFVTLLAQRDNALREAGYAAEIGGLYVRTAHQRRGIGQLLIAAAARSAHEANHVGLSVWTLSGSHQSCGFYRGLGGVEIARRTYERDGVPVPETAFGWTAQALLDQFISPNQGASHAASRTS